MNIDYATTEAELAQVRALREAVFIDEQGIPPEEEWDALDGEARHLLARDGANPAGSLRWRRVEDMAKVERVCVQGTYRGTGLGARMMTKVLEDVRALDGIEGVTLNAQDAATGFYAGFGFVPEGEVFDEAGIPHRTMVLRFR